MEYLIPAVLVLLIVGGAVTFLVLNATRKGGPNPNDGGTPGTGTDHTPLGDTAEHAGEQTSSGETLRQPERTPANEARTSAPPRGDASEVPPPREGEPGTESERLANRPV